jgi:hypothetical protein
MKDAITIFLSVLITMTILFSADTFGQIPEQINNKEAFANTTKK